MKGRNGSTSFLPLMKKGGLNNKVVSEVCLTKDQAKQVYDKIESGDEFKIRKTILQQSNPKLPKQVKERKDVNEYEKVLISDMNMIKNNWMEQWSILSDNIVYVRLEDNDVMNGIDIKMVDYRDHKRMYRKMGKEEEERLNIDFGESPEILRDIKFIRNKATLDITNKTRETLIFDKKTTIGILDLRSLGYYKIKQGVLQQNLNKYYQFEEADKVCEEFNKMVEAIRQEEEKDSKRQKYLWLDDTDERKYMTDKEILDKYIDLKGSCLGETERKQVMEMLYEYKDVFGLRDEIGICPNVEVNIEVTDNSPFFIRPYHMKEEDRAVLDKEMRRLCYLGILKEGFLAYSSPVMLISQKLTSDKSCNRF